VRHRPDRAQHAERSLTRAAAPTVTGVVDHDVPVTPGGARAPRPLLLLALVAALVLTADVVSKIIVVRALADRAPVDLVPGVLDLQLTRNSGAAFSVGTGSTLVFTLVSLAVVVAVMLSARRLRSRGWGLVLGGLLGGALGNLSDRVFRFPGFLRGEVVDWIHLHHWPVFNLADSAIVVAGVCAVILSMTGRPLDGEWEPGRAGRGPQAPAEPQPVTDEAHG